ncbi:MAG: hypothetical protein AB1651_08865 [Pseudomonadota bacterium]
MIWAPFFRPSRGGREGRPGHVLAVADHPALRALSEWKVRTASHRYGKVASPSQSTLKGPVQGIRKVDAMARAVLKPTALTRCCEYDPVDTGAAMLLGPMAHAAAHPQARRRQAAPAVYPMPFRQ